MVTQPKERPIIFDSESVRGILSGSKTQTRRVMKVPDWAPDGWIPDRYNHGAEWAFWEPPPEGSSRLTGNRCTSRRIHSPYGEAGDYLWVRETYQIENASEYGLEAADPPEGPVRIEDGGPAWGDIPLIPRYRATQPDTFLEIGTDDDGFPTMRWRSPLFMPRWASRILLEATDVRAEKLQTINGMDAKREGAPIPPHMPQDGADLDWARRWFRERWDTLNAKHGHRWGLSPWVWVVSFRKVAS